MTRSVYDVQRDFALSCGLRSEIIWDALSPEQADILKQKIEQIIGDNDSRGKKTVARQRQLIFDNVWQQRKYTNNILLSAIIYVLVSNEDDPELAIHSTSFSCHPVIRTRKCLREGSDCDSEGCCMMFIDENGRVYGNWRNYVFNNTLPKGTMIAPSHGIYRFTNDDESGVHLMVHPTPASRVKHKILKAGDTVATVGGLASTVPVAAALAMPIAPPLLLGATVVGMTAAAYSTVRSVGSLYDRRQYGQSTSLRDSDARSNWLGVAGGVVGLGATGATQALSLAADVNMAAQLAVKGINVSSIVLSGTGVANDAYDIYLKISDDQPLSCIDVLRLASSLIIFTHSINNLRLASKVTNGCTLRHTVSHETRKVFSQIANESSKLHTDANGSTKFDFVRTLNDIPYKDVLLSMHEIHKHLVEVGAGLLPNLISLDASGELGLNLELLRNRFGSKFVQHISNEGSLMDLIDALTKYFSEQAMMLLMQLTRKFLDQNVDNLEGTLNTFLSTETVLYRMMMECVQNYKELSAEYLEQRMEEILAMVSNFFRSLEPVSRQTSTRNKCADCHGFYYICD